MIYKVAMAGDLHKRPKDISTIKGYVKCCDKVQDSIIEMIREENLTHFISLGDWYDKGYVDDISSALADTSKEEYMSSILNGNFYGVIGNHIRLRLDSNPELMLIQPHPTIKSRKQVKRDNPIIKTPSHIIFGSVQISLVHHMPENYKLEDYHIHRLPGITYHVACVHDPRFIPNYKLSLTQHPPTDTLDSQIARVLEGVDLCVCGDIHMPLGAFNVSTNTKMIVPGSLTNTNASLKGRHGSIKIPILTIDDSEGTVNLKLKEFNIHINTLSFNDKIKEKVVDKLKTIRGNNLKELYSDSVVGTTISSELSSLSFGNFLKEKGYTSSDKKLIKLTLSNPEDVLNLIRIHYEDLEVDEIQ